VRPGAGRLLPDAAPGGRAYRPQSAGRDLRLLAFGQLFGFVGVLLALPASAVLMVAFKHLRATI
jgi:hypothetical protein